MLNKNKASVLLLDEPTSHIDGVSQKKVLDNLFKIAEGEKQTVLMVAHRLDTAVEYCDYVMVLDKGELDSFDTAANLLFENPGSDEAVTKTDS
mmetsp:Transcript_4432/g.6533  ORF Transcript_4432/g.6533 Transcript_4432/m.6533 type:complete len:93 (-) Transcript_4432:100-378(-)